VPLKLLLNFDIFHDPFANLVSWLDVARKVQDFLVLLYRRYVGRTDMAIISIESRSLNERVIDALHNPDLVSSFEVAVRYAAKSLELGHYNGL
jgi:hypothetical protein